jgi:hypothetical protein
MELSTKMYQDYIGYALVHENCLRAFVHLGSLALTSELMNKCLEADLLMYSTYHIHTNTRVVCSMRKPYQFMMVWLLVLSIPWPYFCGCGCESIFKPSSYGSNMSSYDKACVNGCIREKTPSILLAFQLCTFYTSSGGHVNIIVLYIALRGNAQEHQENSFSTTAKKSSFCHKIPIMIWQSHMTQTPRKMARSLIFTVRLLVDSFTQPNHVACID